MARDKHTFRKNERDFFYREPDCATAVKAGGSPRDESVQADMTVSCAPFKA
jgi:hypothetical protein